MTGEQGTQKRQPGDDYQDAPKLKRKKTVTWADGEDLPVGHTDGDDGSDVDVQQLEIPNTREADKDVVRSTSLSIVKDDLYKGVDEGVLQNQEPVPKTEPEVLTQQQLIQRRIQNIDNLIEVYKSEYWGLAEELQLKYQQFSEQNGGPALKDQKAVVEALEKQLKEKGITASGSLQDVWKELHCVDSSSHQNDAQTTTTTAAMSIPSYHDVEKLILGLPTLDESNQREKRTHLQNQKKEFLQRLNALGRMEAGAVSSMMRELETRHAVGVLCGDKNMYYMTKTAITLGRNIEKRDNHNNNDISNTVDVDISLEGGSKEQQQAVSRQQAQVYLDSDGCFMIKNTGNRALVVNNSVLNGGQVEMLPNLSYVGVSGYGFMFVQNQEAVDRILNRSSIVNV